LRRILRGRRYGRSIKQAGHVQAALRREGQRLVVESAIGHVPLRADDDPDHRHHRDQSAGHRAFGRCPGHQHPQREETQHGAGGDTGHGQRQLKDVAETVHEEHHAHAQDA